MPGDPARLLSSWPKFRGLHPAGALPRLREERRQSSCRKIRPDCSAVGPNLGGYTQWVRWRAPTETREEFCPVASSRQKKKKGAAKRLAAWPVEPDRPGPSFERPGARRLHPAGAPALFGKLRLGYTKTNVSSSPADFFTARARITSSDARGLSPHFITVASLFAPAPARVGPGTGRLA